MKTLKQLLKNPPQKRVICPRCSGGGVINRRGIIISDDCPRCSVSRGWVTRGTGKIWVTNYDRFATEVRKVVKAEIEKKELN